MIFSLYQWRCLNNPDSHSRPFILTLGLIFLGFSGLGISIWPHIIPPSITLWQAAAPTQSRGFMLVGALLIIPVIWSTPSGVTTYFAAKFSMGRVITDATTGLEKITVAGHYLGRQRTGAGCGQYALPYADDGGRV